VRSFATATDGNHGLGLAWVARQFGQKCFVYMPKGSSKYRLTKIQEQGAHAEITDKIYDDTVRYVSQLAKENGWVLVQDTAWEAYVDIPKFIMQGYFTIVDECMDQLVSMKKNPPSLVILQAGVGSFAAAVVDALKVLVKEPITFVVVEPIQADCFYQSACSSSGTGKKTSGDLSTIMAGLSCGEPNPLAWKILKEATDCFVKCPDSVSARGMRVLGNPLANDPKIISGESGAVPLGLLFEICQNPVLKDLKNKLHLNSDSRVLLISTEGDTDPEHYRKICWNGLYPTLSVGFADPPVGKDPDPNIKRLG
jgi:diaminopropionate ammonia-lyase